MRKLATLMLAASLLVLGGCHKVTYVSKSRAPRMEQQEHDMRFFLWGLVGTSDVPVSQLCPTGLARLQTRMSFLDVFLTVITIGVYAPRTAVVTCAQ